MLRLTPQLPVFKCQVLSTSKEKIITTYRANVLTVVALIMKGNVSFHHTQVDGKFVPGHNIQLIMSHVWPIYFTLR